jgi:hypothetical protein
MDVIYMNPGYLATYRKCLQFIHGLENEKVRSIIWETPKDCGLNDSIFIDYGHFSKEGHINSAEDYTVSWKIWELSDQGP